MFIKKIVRNLFAIVGILILMFLLITTTPFFKIEHTGYSVGLILFKMLDIPRIYIIVVGVQLLLITLGIVLFSKIGSKIISILSIIITIILVNLILFINLSSETQYNISLGVWLMLSGFILVGINHFIDFSKNITSDKPLIEKEERVEIMKDNLFNNPKKLVTISLFTTIISYVIHILSWVFMGASLDVLLIYLIMAPIVYGTISNTIYFYSLKNRIGRV